MVWDDEDEYEPQAPMCIYPRKREGLGLRLKRWLVTWVWMVLPVLVLTACSLPARAASGVEGPVVMVPYCGYYDWSMVLRPYLKPGVTGAGFALFLWVLPWIVRRISRWRRRRYLIRRLNFQGPSRLDRLWRATIGRLMASLLKTWQDERGGPIEEELYPHDPRCAWFSGHLICTCGASMRRMEGL